MKKFFLLIFITSSSFFGCEKVSIVENNEQTESRFFPDVKNGTLYFENENALKAYYTYLSDLIEGVDDYEEALTEKENQFDYLSLRRSLGKMETVSFREGEEDEFTKEEILQQMESEFIPDEIRLSILNSYYEVGIGEDLFVYMSQNQIYKIIGSDPNKRDLLRSLPKGNNEVVYFREEIDGLTVELISETKDIFTLYPVDPATLLVTTEPFKLQMEVTHIKCNALTKKFTGRFLYKDPQYTSDVWVWYDAEKFEFDSDESSPLLNFIEVTGDDNSSYKYTHTYGSPGEYHPSVQVTYYNEFSALVTSFYTMGTPVKSFLSCTSVSNDNSDWVDDGAKAMSYKVWYSHDIFGTHAGSYTHGWHWRPSKNKWKRQAGNIYVRIDATFRDDECEVDATKWKSDSSSSAKRKRAAVTKWGYSDISEDDVYSSHSFSRDGHSFSETLVLDVCN